LLDIKNVVSTRQSHYIQLNFHKSSRRFFDKSNFVIII